MPTPYPSSYVPLVNGSSVSAEVLNIPLNTLEQRTVALKQQIDNALIGTTQIARDVPLDASTTRAGMAVYRTAAGVYKPGLASTTVVNNAVQLDLSAYVWGIVLQKTSNTTGHVILGGPVRFKEDDLRTVLNIADSDDVPNGTVFLSGTVTQKGYLTFTKPPIGIVIGQLVGPDGVDSDGNNLYTLLVNIAWRDPFEGHVHYYTRLGNTYSDWVPVAEWASSNPTLTAPVGAIRHYQHKNTGSPLKELWPPIPISSVAYDVDGVAADLVNNTSVLINNDGIWWMNTSLNVSNYRHDFWFTKMTFKNTSAVVTSLVTDTPGVEITNLDGDPASVGDLLLSVGFSPSLNATNAISGKAIKSASGLTLSSGPVVEGIRSSSGITVSGSSSFSDGGNTYYNGLVNLNISNPQAREGPVHQLELDGVIVERVSNIELLTFKNTATSKTNTIRGKIKLPELNVPSTMTLTLKVLVWFRNGLTTAPSDLAMTYLRIPKPATTGAAEELTTTYTTISGGLDLSSVTSYANTPDQIALFTTDIPVSVYPGDVVYYTLSRTTPDNYGYDISIIDQSWVIN